MIFLKLYDPSIATSTVVGSENPLYVVDTKSKLVDGGYEVDNQYYYPALLNQPKFSFKGKNWVKPSLINIDIDREFAKRFSSVEIEVTAWLWGEESDTSKFIVFDGVGIKGKYNSLTYTYRCEEKDHGLKDDLLELAPDLEEVGYIYSVVTATSGTNTITVGEDVAPPESTGTLTIGGDDYSYTSFSSGVFTLSSNLTQTYSDNFVIINNTKTFTTKRVRAMNFGYVKHITPLLLATACVSTGCSTAHSADGEVTNQYDNGQGVNYEQTGNISVKTGSNPVYQTTQDINATSAVEGAVVTATDPIPLMVTTTKNNVVIKEDISGTKYLIYVKDATDTNVTLSVDEDGNAVFGGDLLSASYLSTNDNNKTYEIIQNSKVNFASSISGALQVNLGIYPYNHSSSTVTKRLYDSDFASTISGSSELETSLSNASSMIHLGSFENSTPSTLTIQLRRGSTVIYSATTSSTTLDENLYLGGGVLRPYLRFYVRYFFSGGVDVYRILISNNIFLDQISGDGELNILISSTSGSMTNGFILPMMFSHTMETQ
jgi:hypothetical protein